LLLHGHELLHHLLPYVSGKTLKWILFSVGILAALFVLHRLLSWAEDRGWVYYRTRKFTITLLATALFRSQAIAIVQPEKQHVVAAKRQSQEEEDGDGKPQPPI
jgi:hypothetical protein